MGEFKVGDIVEIRRGDMYGEEEECIYLPPQKGIIAEENICSDSKYSFYKLEENDLLFQEDELRLDTPIEVIKTREKRKLEGYLNLQIGDFVRVNNRAKRNYHEGTYQIQNKFNPLDPDNSLFSNMYFLKGVDTIFHDCELEKVCIVEETSFKYRFDFFEMKYLYVCEKCNFHMLSDENIIGLIYNYCPSCGRKITQSSPMEENKNE